MRIKKARCVACGKVIAYEYDVMGTHAAQCYPHHLKDWQGFESVE